MERYCENHAIAIIVAWSGQGASLAGCDMLLDAGMEVLLCAKFVAIDFGSCHSASGQLAVLRH